MHYTAMGAASFTTMDATMVPGGVAVPTLGVLAISAVVFIVLATTLLTATLQRRDALVSASIAGGEEMRVGYEQFLRDVIDADPHMVFAKDREGRFTLVNQATATMYGTTPAALVGKKDSDLNPMLKEVESFQKDDRYVIDTGKSRTVPEERVTNAKTGETRWFHTIKVPLLSADGKTHHVLGVATDITERKLLEAQLRQAQKMEAVGRLAGGVAHDFNNLLTAIIGHTDMLIEEEGAAMPRHVREDISEIRKSAQRAASLTRQLLAFSRKQVLEPRIVDLNALVVNINALLNRLIGEHIELHTTQDPKLKMIEADPGQLEQVVMNLAVNARDAMPNGGKLVIETANVTLGADATRERPAMPAGRYVMLAISDNGIGMSPEVQSHLFEPFFTTKPAGEGTGLGLATVYGIIKQTGGYVWVYSEPGIGTTFKLYFPPVEAAISEPEPEPASPLPLPPSTAETILVVEDEDAVRCVTSRVLVKRGYEVLEASGGEQAIRIANEFEGRINLLLTDVVMPRMSGRELAAILVESRPDMKVMYVSGYTDDAIVRHGILEPGVIFLQKPFSPDTLARKVAETLSKS
jgi:PAS domain S-box-containing protein